MIILQASNVARRFSGVTFFENISMQIQDKGRVGLVGRGRVPLHAQSGWLFA